jgi:hypothetical protein
MKAPTRIVALALAACLSVLGMACEQQDTGDPIENGADTEDGAGTDGATPTPEDT